jgi:dynein light intermediate chain
MRKALQTEQGKNEMESRIQTLEGDVKDLERQVQEWKLKCDAIEKRETERREAEAKKHKEDVQYLENYAKQLKQQLEQFLVPNKKAPAAGGAPA